MVGRHRGYLGIIHAIQPAIPVDAHTADAKLAGINKAPPLANMTPHLTTRECLIEHRLPFHPLSLYHHSLPQRNHSPEHNFTRSPTTLMERDQQPNAGNKSPPHKLELLPIHLAQVGNAQGTELIAFDIGLHQDIVGAMEQGEARSIIND